MSAYVQALLNNFMYLFLGTASPRVTLFGHLDSWMNVVIDKHFYMQHRVHDSAQPTHSF
jgi:hypothetical protein